MSRYSIWSIYTELRISNVIEEKKSLNEYVMTMLFYWVGIIIIIKIMNFVLYTYLFKIIFQPKTDLHSISKYTH